MLIWIDRQPHRAWRHVSHILRHFQTRVSGSPFGRRTLVMLLGTVFGQTVSVALAPLLTRLYTPEQFGTLGVYMSAITIMAVMGALCYEIAMPAAKNAEAASNTLALCLACLVLTTAGVSLALRLIPSTLVELLRFDRLPYWRLLIPLGFALVAAYHTMLYYAIWAQDFATISRTRITQGVAGPLAQIACGVLQFGALGLCIGFIIGQSSGTLLLFNRLVITRMETVRRISVRGMLAVAWRNRAFPLISSWGMMVDMAGAGQIAYLLVATLYPGPLAGFMFLSERLVGRPLMMLSTSILSVYMAEIGQTVKTDPRRMQMRFRQVILRQLMVGAAWVLAVDLGAVLAFRLAFGAAWADAVPVVLALSGAFLLINVVTSVGHTLQILGRQGMAATWQVGRLAAVSAGFLLCAHFHVGPYRAILGYTCIQCTACVVLLLMMDISISRLQISLEVRPA